MKRLAYLLYLLALTSTAWAQEDFYNDYVITMSGTMSPPNDPGADCGSGFYFDVIFDDGSRTNIIPQVTVAGFGVHGFSGRVIFSSKNKVRSLYVWARNENSDWFGDCDGSNFDGELSFNPTYPCHDKAHDFDSGPVGYHFETTITIQPLTKNNLKLSVNMDLRNNANEEFENDPLITDNFGTVTLVRSKNSFQYQLTANFDDGSSETFFSEQVSSFSPGGVISRQRTNIYAGIKKPVTMHLFSEGVVFFRGEDFRSAPIVVARKKSTANHDFTVSGLSVPGNATSTFTLYPNASASQITLTTSTYGLPIKYGPDANYILPYDTADRVTILGPAGNPAAFYHWVYSVDGTNWIDLPDKFQGKHRLSISGYDLQGEEFLKYHGTNVFFKLVIDCSGGESDIITLSRRASVPRMVSVTPYPDRCYDKESDGSFKVIFARPLLTDATGKKEQLTILVTDPDDDKITYRQLDGISLDHENSFTWPRELLSDRQYKIKLLGDYIGIPTYSDNPGNHTRVIELIRPQPITSGIAAKAVHCYNGGDGIIHLKAQGGVGNYTFRYLPAGATDSLLITFAGDTTHTLDFLRYGIYGFSVMDGNKCGDAAGAKAILVDQPSDSLHIGFSKTTDPIAYRYKDGYIETILAGGTPFPDQSYTVQWFDPVNLLPDSFYNNAPLAQGYQANIDSLGDGYYQLRAYDSEYTKAHPDHRKGCMVVSDTFRLLEPPPLQVDIAERHFVSCHGYNDGELVAHAKGGVAYINDLPYQYEWLRDINGTTQSVSQQDSIATQLKTGIYRIRIRDKNKIEKLSDPFLLVEPDVLTAAVTTTPISCSSGTDGTALVTSTGGTLPYTYSWSDGATTALNVNLIEGRYFVLVKDVRGCTATANGSVASPSPLQVDSLLTNPQCFGYENGSIDITVIQGTPPYRYSWSNGAETEDIDQLPAGIYTVKITDDNDCINYRRYELIDPAPVHVDLGRDRTLCTNQVYIADATIDDPGAQYQWSGPNGFAAQTGIVTISEDGTYTVQVVDSHECHGEDAIAIRRIQVNIGSEFIVTTQAFKDKIVTLVNISDPQPDSVEWWASESDVRFTSSLINKAELTFADTGTYIVSMRAYRQGCEKDFSKSIVVVAGTFDENVKDESPFLEEFTVSPNPSDGKFSAIIALREQTPIRIRMISVASNVIVDDREALGSQRYELPYDLNLASGVYFLLLETAKGNYILRVTIY